jgi:hypothetical protein
MELDDMVNRHSYIRDGRGIRGDAEVRDILARYGYILKTSDTGGILEWTKVQEYWWYGE